MQAQQITQKEACRKQTYKENLQGPSDMRQVFLCIAEHLQEFAPLVSCARYVFGPLHLSIANTGQSQSVTHVACERVQAEGSWSRYLHARRYDYYPAAAPSSWLRPKPSPTWMSTGCASWPVYPRLLRDVGACASWNFCPRLLQSELWNLQHETYLHCD